MTSIGSDYVDVRQATEVSQQARAMRMQLCRKHCSARVAPGEQCSLAAGSGTTIENHLSTTGQQCDQLRSFILNGDAAFLIGARSGYVARKNAPCSRQQSTRRQLHSGRGKLGINVPRLIVVNVNGRVWHRLIMAQICRAVSSP